MPTETALAPGVLRDLATALAVADMPAVHWIADDGLCDCTFQRVCEWTNPYFAKTLRVRLCCIWAELYKQYPQFVQDIPAYYDANRHRYVMEPAEWDNPTAPMPVSAWHRYLAAKEGKPLAQIRQEYAGREHERPQAVPRAADYVPDTPSEAERRAALEHRLRAGTWILDDEELNPAWRM
jgi:hypothetical protein